MTEPVESLDFTDKDQQDLERLLTEGQEPEFHTVLEVWREVLKPAADLADDKVTPQWASRMVATYSGLTYGDMPDLQSLYYEKIVQLFEILLAEIATDSDCLTYRNPVEDVKQNSGHYKQLLTDWQLAFLQWELDWDCTSYNAAVELAAISEVHKMFFGPTGVTAFLDNIQFEFNEADQAELAATLNALRDGKAGDSE